MRRPSSRFQLRVALLEEHTLLTLVLETLAMLTDVLHCWTKVKPERLSNAMLLLEHYLRVNGI